MSPPELAAPTSVETQGVAVQIGDNLPPTKLGRKGYGKGNYGFPVPVPQVVAQPDTAGTGSLSSHDIAPVQPDVVTPGDSDLPDECPEPIRSTPEDIEQWLAESFKPLKNLSQNLPPEVGEDILWRGFKVGPRGGASTQTEYFNGKVRALNFDNESHELFVYVD